MSGQVIQDWEPLDHPLVTQLTVHCNYVIVNTLDTLYGGVLEISYLVVHLPFTYLAVEEDLNK
jgi:hypothetical protein